MLDQLNDVLAGFGPWGALAGIAITLALNYYRTGKLLPAAPANPVPNNPAVPDTPPNQIPNPQPTLPTIPGRPLLNLALQLLPLLSAWKAKKAAAPVTPSGPAVQAVADPLDVYEDAVVAQLAIAVDPTKP